MLIELINPETRLCAIDRTALRSSKYDSEAKIYNHFLILADATYDSAEQFEISSDLEFNLLTDINIRQVKSIELLESMIHKNIFLNNHL